MTSTFGKPLSCQEAGDLYHALHMETKNCPACKGTRRAFSLQKLLAVRPKIVDTTDAEEALESDDGLDECGRCARSLDVLSSIDGMTAEERTGQRALDFMVEDLGWVHNV